MGIEFYRSEVNVLIEFKTHSQKDPFFQNSWFYIRMADSTQINGIEIFKFFQNRIRKDISRFLVAFSADVIMHKLILN